MKSSLQIISLAAVMLTAIQCTTPSYTVPYAQIHAKAWRPGDVGEVKVPLYVNSDGLYHSLQDVDLFRQGEMLSPEEFKSFGIMTILQSGDRIKVTNVRRYPMSTVDDVEVRGVVINGSHAGLKVCVSSPLCNAAGDFWGPNPEFIARLQDAN